VKLHVCGQCRKNKIAWGTHNGDTPRVTLPRREWMVCWDCNAKKPFDAREKKK
jgi:hypothetical protein